MSDLAKVTDLDAARSSDRVDETMTLSRMPLTALVQVSNVRADGEVHRHVGVNDAMTFEELRRVIQVCFDLREKDVPWHFFEVVDGERKRVEPQRQVSEVLWDEGSAVEFLWGLWEFSVVVTEIYPRDGGSPQALCIGGSSAFPGSEFDLTPINSELTGQDASDEALKLVKDPVYSVIERSMLFDFVPLVQALDLAREVELDAGEKRIIAKLPLEGNDKERDAFWSTVLALTCLSGKELTEEIMETTMNALGWRQEGGEPYSAEQIRALCAASLEELSKIGGVGKNARPPLYRLEIFREILGRHEP